MDKTAYRNEVFRQDTIAPVPLKDWKQLAKRIELQQLHSKKRTGSESSLDTEIDKATPDWTSSEREKFRYWYRNSRRASLESAETAMQVRTAEYAPFESQQRLDEFHKQRRSMMRRLRKLQNELSDAYEQSRKLVEWSDDRYPTPEKKLEAIQTAINQICVLLGTLKTKEVTAAAIRRTAGFLNSVDAEAGKKFLEAIGGTQAVVKVAATAPLIEVAKKLKHELDTLHYGTHLRRFFTIYETLIQAGHEGIAQDIEELIQKDLGDIAKVYKRISEVYSDLLKIPASEAVAKESAEKETPVVTTKPAETSSEFQTPKIEKVNVPAV